MSNCNDTTLSVILSIVKNIVTLIQIFVPILLIVFAIISFIKLVKNKERKNSAKKIINQFLAAVIIFFIPMVVDVIMGLLDDKMEFSKCWREAKGFSFSYNYVQIENEDRKIIYQDASGYEHGISSSKLYYDGAVEVPKSVLNAASKSDLSIVVADDEGKVLAYRKADALREGGSTTKVFTGYAAVKLLDPESDIIVCTQYAQNMPYMGDPDVTVGQKFSVAKAATYKFPGSSNIMTANIAIAIGKKYYNSTDDKNAYVQGMELINKFLKDAGCEKTKLVSSSGVNYNYSKGKWGEFDDNGYSKGEDGITANDLALIVIDAMKDEYFASGISGRNSNGLFLIKYGTQSYKHGIWGFNYKGRRYYIIALGFNFKQEGDKRAQVSKNIYNWTINNLIK